MKNFFKVADLKVALGTFVSSLAASPVVAALMGGHLNVGVAAVVAAVVSAAVAVVHKFVHA